MTQDTAVEEKIETTKSKALEVLKRINRSEYIRKDEMKVIASEIEELIEILEGKTCDIQVQRMYRFESDRPLKAFADILINDELLIKGLKVLEGKQGLFVSMPQEQAKDQKWYDTVRCLTQEAKDQVTQVVLAAYKEE